MNKKIDKKKDKLIKARLRAAIQLVFFIFLPGAFVSAFAGVRYIVTQIGQGSLIELTSFVVSLIALCAFTAIFGRFFCGFACAFGSLGDAVNALYKWTCKKRKRKPVVLSGKVAKHLYVVKYIVLALIAIACYLGVYDKLSGADPWTAFSMLHARNLSALTGYTVGIVLLVLIMVGMALEERFFCRFLCPMGAVFSLLPVLPIFSLRRDRPNCIPGCQGCTRTCPASIELPSDEEGGMSGECFQCGKCVGVCPKSNIHAGLGLKGDEIWINILRAVALGALLIWLGI